MLTTIRDELRAASYASLRAHPISHEAEALVSTLAGMLEDKAIATGARKNKRKGTAEKLEYATGAFLADLLQPFGDDAPTQNPWVYRSMHAKSFSRTRTGSPVSYRTFVSLVDGLQQLGLLQHVDGHKVSSEPEDTGRFGARFRATPALLHFCRERNVDPASALDHFEFEYDLPKEVLELREAKKDAYWLKTRPPGKPMKFEEDGITRAMEANLRELNEFFAQHKLRGAKHHGYIRMFHNGNDPRFGWNMGGRLYSQHFTESYQVMSGDARRKMTINDQPVAEIDIRASYLTIFLSLHGIQLPEGDPYDLPGLGPEHRNAVKAWMVATFGNSKPIVRWPKRMREKSPELKRYRVSDITQAAMSKYPTLESWGSPLEKGAYGHKTCGWPLLMWVESNAVISTMLELKREYQTPSLSVHDSLITPAASAETARKVLKEKFRSHVGVTPLLKINWPLSRDTIIREPERLQGDQGRPQGEGERRW